MGNYKDSLLQPYIITHEIPRIKSFAKNIATDSVSLVENKCDKATNNLKVNYARPQTKEDFAVCVPFVRRFKRTLSSMD
jgi:hypothetical protein